MSQDTSVESVWYSQNNAYVQDVQWKWTETLACSSGTNYPNICHACPSAIWWQWNGTVWVQGWTWSLSGGASWQPQCGATVPFTVGYLDLLYWPAGYYDLEHIVWGNSVCGTQIVDSNHYVTITNP